jgi:hypothetical protein
VIDVVSFSCSVVQSISGLNVFGWRGIALFTQPHLDLTILLSVKFDAPPSSLCRDNSHDAKDLNSICIRQLHVLEIPNLTCRASVNANSGPLVSFAELTRAYHLHRIKKEWSITNKTSSNDIIHHLVHAIGCTRPTALQ